MISNPIARLFWDMNPDALDPTRDRRVIIPRVLNYGTLADFKKGAAEFERSQEE